jgi:nucleoid-associated protein YgaU
MANNTNGNPKDGLALVVGGLFILALVFATYNYFNKSSEGELGEGGAFETMAEEEGAVGVSGQALGTGGSVTTTEVAWVATDYQEGDISGPTYTVKSGDTLWEIAEAVYGSGYEWHKILDANSDDIGYLPNGSQALIIPGQVLTLP